MTLEKAIEHGHEHRKPYYRSGRFDKTCRPHGGCSWCLDNRLHAWERRLEQTADQLREYLDSEV